MTERILRRLDPRARSQVTVEDYLTALPEIGDDRVLPFSRTLELAPLLAMLAEAMERYAGKNPSLSDAWLAPRVHACLRLQRSEASGRGTWDYLSLTVPEVRAYILWRWTDSSGRLNLQRVTGTTVRHGIARLWWMAELSRNGPDYAPVEEASRSQDMSLQILDNDAFHNRAATAAYIQMLSRERNGDSSDSDRARNMARWLNHALTTNVLDAIAPDPGPDPVSVSGWLDEEPDETLMYDGLPEGPDDGKVDEEDVQRVLALLERLESEAVS